MVGVMLGMRWIGAKMVDGDPHCTRWRGVIGRVLAKTTIVFMVVAAIDIVVTYAAVPPRRRPPGRHLLHHRRRAAGRDLGARADSWHDFATRRRRAGETTLGNANVASIRVLVSVALFASRSIVILDNLGVNVTALIAGLGIGGIAIGLAAQGIFSDLFAALAILFDRPFRRGDTIRYDQTTGTVERIGLKTTRMRSLSRRAGDHGQHQIARARNSQSRRRHSRRTKLLFGLVYRTDPDLLEQLPEITRAIIGARSGCTMIRCAITGFGASSIDYELLFDHATVDVDMVAADRTAVVIEMLRTFARHGIEIAYPTQTTFTAAPDGRMIMPYPDVQSVVRLDRDEAGV